MSTSENSPGGTDEPTDSAAYDLKNLRVEKAKNLTPEQQAEEERFARALDENLDEFIGRYTKKFANALNVDDARELSEVYNKNNKSRAIYSAAVHEPCSALIGVMYERYLATKADNAIFFFLAGGSGAGKSTALRKFRSNARFNAILEKSQIVYDTTLSGPSGQRRVKQALDAGKLVIIMYVHRRFEDAVASVVQRAMEHGRTVPLSVVANAHFGAWSAILELHELYKEDKRVEFYFLSADAAGGLQHVPVETIANERYDRDGKSGMAARARKEYENVHRILAIPRYIQRALER